jgi:hypothetical protein
VQRRTLGKTLGTFAAASELPAIPASGAQAYNPGGILYRLGGDACLKGRGNYAIYPKSAQLPGGRLVASFEKSTVVPKSGPTPRSTSAIRPAPTTGWSTAGPAR